MVDEDVRIEIESWRPKGDRSGRPIRSIALPVGVSVGSVHKVLADPPFRQADAGGINDRIDPFGCDSYQTCAECGRDCEPEPSALDGLGARIVFFCPEHGVHSIVDSFHGER
ncbi:hypothetical protein [Arthrobacter pigmenti]